MSYLLESCDIIRLYNCIARWAAKSLEGGEAMTFYEAMMVAISFATLVVLIVKGMNRSK